MTQGDREPERDEHPATLAGHLALYLREPTLWPVLVVVLAAVTAFGASALLLALRDHNPLAAGAVLVAGVASVELCLRDRRRGGFGAATAIVAVGWLLSAGAAGTAVALGWY